MFKKLNSLLMGGLAILAISCAKDIVDLTGSVNGTVKDYNNGQLISNCLISISPGGASYTTDSSGQFEFKDLEPGEYSLTFKRSGYEDSSHNVTITAGKESSIQVLMKELTASLSLSTNELEFGSTTSTMSFTLGNTGKGTLEWYASENADWLSCSPDHGNVSPSQSASVVVTVNREKLDKGNYSENLVISSNAGSEAVAVTMTVAPVELEITPSSLDFGATESSMTVSMVNPSGRTLKYTVSVSNEWLSVSKTSGSISAKDSFSAIVSRSGLSVGEYDGNIFIDVEGELFSIPVKMSVAQRNKPTVSIEDVLSVTSNSATIRATIKSVGSSKVMRYGVCWSMSSMPTVDDMVTNLGDCMSAKSFECHIGDLEHQTKYYVRAYAENLEGISYSDQTLSFTTSQRPSVPSVKTLTVSVVTATTAKAAGQILSLGNVDKITSYGHVWGTSPQPTLTTGSHSDLGSTTSTKEFTTDMSSLSDGTKYYVRAYATNSEGTAYGEDVDFTTTSFGQPSVTIGQVTEIKASSFSISGEITSTGGLDVTQYGHCWSTSQNPTISDSKTSLGSTSQAQKFSSSVTSLHEKTTYYIRAYATNSKGTSYSNQLTVTTTEAGTDVWDGRIATSFAGGSGSSVDPYIIQTGGQLLLIKDYNNKYFKLANNIDLNNHNWLPFEFRGTLDGGNHIIKNLFISRSTDNQGLFSIITGATISNIKIIGVIINAGSCNNIGALAGDMKYGNISNCNVVLLSDSKLLGNNNVGGLLGSMGNGYADKKMISQCSVKTEGTCIIGESNIGGILGYYRESYNGEMARCIFDGSLKGSKKVGGIIGFQQYGKLTLKQCASSGSVAGDSYVGGLFGSCEHNGSGCTYIYGSKAVVAISVASGYAGGLFGGDSKYMNIIACYANGTVTSSNPSCNYISGIGVGADCELSYSTITSTLENYKQLGYLNVQKNCAGSYTSDNITIILHDAYSVYANHFNFDSIWTWTGIVDGKTKNVSCPKLSWE